VHIMTCREFKHSAASLTLWEVSQVQSGSRSHSEDERIVNHADSCESCATWLRKQRSLAASMRTLQAQTVGLEAGPGVEQALLAAFRRNAATSFARAGVAPRFDAGRPHAASGFPPIAMRLSRFFEIGAYTAVAAAIIVGVFLGMQILPHSRTTPSQTASSPASLTPAAAKPVGTEQAELTNTLVSSGGRQSPPLQGLARPKHAPVRDKTNATAQSGIAVASQTSMDDDGYVALMFCDPLSCSSDAQVVRMELPAGRDAQPQIADVVVGYDGLVRAVRIVN
jgi:hypothetical protein